MMEELKPCPFCGGADAAVADATRILGVFLLTHRCPAVGTIQIARATTEAVVAVWNTRTPPT